MSSSRIYKRLRISAAALLAATVLAGHGAAWAQTNGQNDRNDRNHVPPPRTHIAPMQTNARTPAVPPLQTNVPPIPNNVPPIPMNVPPIPIPSATLGDLNAPYTGGVPTVGTVIIQQPYYGYYPGYYYPGYSPYYPGGETTVIVNGAPVTYPTENGWAHTPPTAAIVQTLPNGQTAVSSGPLYDGYIFPGYASAYIDGQTVLSPFGAYAGCPRYVSSRYVRLSAPWPYIHGRDTDVVIAPWSAADPYMTANAARGAALRAALGDISRFWEQGSTASLRRRILSDLTVAVFQGERFAYSLRRPDFLSLASDALDQVDTVSFRFTDVRERTDGLVSATALHTYRPRSGPNRSLHTARVRCTLVYLDGDWYLSAFALAPDMAGTPPAAPSPAAR